jgi:hypothetical protein
MAIAIEYALYLTNLIYINLSSSFASLHLCAKHKRLFEKYEMKPIISRNLTPLPPFPTREWGFQSLSSIKSYSFSLSLQERVRERSGRGRGEVYLYIKNF